MTQKKLTPTECIELLSPELKSYLYEIHQETITSTVRDGKLNPKAENYLPPDVLSLKKHRYKILSAGTAQFQGKDAEILDCYISSFPKSIKQREMTKTMTDVVDGLTNLIMHIGIWITHEYRPDLHITLYVISRRKDWEGEETKYLLKSVELVYTTDTDSVSPIQPPIIRDLFGIRVILEQTDDTNVLLQVMKIIVAILTNPSSKEYIGFYHWVRNTDKLYGGSPIPKERLLRFLEYDFSMSHEKNYINNPKSNGYQSWQATFTVEASSPKAGGSMFELQGRTSLMEEKLEYGGNLSEDDTQLAHFDYKKELYELRKEIFSIKDYTGGLLFFNPSIDYDIDGIGKPKQIAARTSSVHLVSEKMANTET